MTAPSSYPRFDQCSETCTADCGHCKGRPVAALRAELDKLRERSVVVAPWPGFRGHWHWSGKAVAVHPARPEPGPNRRAVVLDVDHVKVLEMTAERAEILGAELIAAARASKEKP